VAAGDGHRHRQEAEAHPLEAAADNEEHERVRDGGEHRAQYDHAEREHDDVALVGPVGEPTEHGVTRAPVSRAAVSSHCAVLSETWSWAAIVGSAARRGSR